MHVYLYMAAWEMDWVVLLDFVPNPGYVDDCVLRCPRELMMCMTMSTRTHDVYDDVHENS